MKFFVYTLAGTADARFARATTVNAQPLREILAMTVMRSGNLYLLLPKPKGVADAQLPDEFEVEHYAVADHLESALLLTQLTPTDFSRGVKCHCLHPGCLYSVPTLEKLQEHIDEYEARATKYQAELEASAELEARAKKDT